MLNIEITFFGSPKVFVNKKRVIFPYKKAEALFYYLFFEKTSSRNNLTEMFWGDFQEDSAKKNLRDALYNIKKVFGFDIITSPKQTFLMLNDQYTITSDVDNFSKTSAISLYKGEFLDSFVVKNSFSFEE
ncbi:MAG: hypothetical protein GXZ08_00290 [Tissierellia bacterium]|nr:hypothetical protein [Tissierellia bacterium]